MTDAEKLKIYVQPYYQEEGDADFLAQQLTEYKTPEMAAAVTWRLLPPQISAGKVRVYTTAASSTTFHRLLDVLDFCHKMAEHFENLHNAKYKIGSIAVLLDKTLGVGGVKE